MEYSLLIYSVTHLIIYTAKYKLGTVLDTEDTLKTKIDIMELTKQPGR